MFNYLHYKLNEHLVLSEIYNFGKIITMGLLDNQVLDSKIPIFSKPLNENSQIIIKTCVKNFVTR